MAQSPAHRFGQMIGNLIEAIMLPLLEEFCRNKQGLYLDHKSKHRSVRQGKKVSWRDKYGNVHDLDFVIEKGGSDHQRGRPIAFIECAWRRYTKHSRNKAQEIQGAILPLAETYWELKPFLGAVLAGVFTKGALQQLKSQGFEILHFPYESLVEAFKAQGIDIAFDETTPDTQFAQVLEEINDAVLGKVREHLIKRFDNEIKKFMQTLERSIARVVDKVLIIPLYGKTFEFTDIQAAMNFLEQHPQDIEAGVTFRRYDIVVKFVNGDSVEGSFHLKDRAKEFLEFIATAG